MWEDLAFVLSVVGFVVATVVMLVELRGLAVDVVDERVHHR
jgi:hypothetical protein